jgi:hypothetical protein
MGELIAGVHRPRNGTFSYVLQRETDPVPWDAVLITIAAILFFKYGKRLRGNSRFAQGS